MNEDTKKFYKLPSWPTYRRNSPKIPIAYGYMPSPEDELVLVPDPELMGPITKALEYLNAGGSLRETAKWLSQETGKPLTHQTLNMIWKRQVGNEDMRNPRNKRLATKEKMRDKEEKRRTYLKLRREAKKRSMEALDRKIKKLEGTVERETEVIDLKPEPFKEPPPISVTDDIDLELIEAQPSQRPHIFVPNPGPQTQFLSASEQEVLYGGAAGGGKSYALVADPVRDFDKKSFNGLLLRRTNDQLRELIRVSQEMYPRLYPKAVWNERKSSWKFPSGAELWMTYLERDEDVYRYHGQAFTWIAMDELTNYPTPFPWNYLRSRLRSADPNINLSMRATTNPGGVGHGWVKKMFIDPAPPNTPFPAIDIESGNQMVYPEGHAKAGKPLFYRRFIPARLYDNPYLLQDSSYEASLLSLSDNLRRQLLDGDWNIADGAAFPEFRVKTHVISPFDIPPDWRRFRSCDYGYSSYSAVHWFAVDPTFETLIVYRELYVSKHTGRDLARKILSLERGENISYGVLDSSVWRKTGQMGPSVAEEMITEGCRWRPADRSSGSRTARKNRLHELLKVTEYDSTNKVPGIVFFDNCRQIISDLQVIPQDPHGKDDIDERYASDHSYDSICYGIMSRPRPTSIFEMTGVSSDSYRPFSNTFGY